MQIFHDEFCLLYIKSPCLLPDLLSSFQIVSVRENLKISLNNFVFMWLPKLET